MMRNLLLPLLLLVLHQQDETPPITAVPLILQVWWVESHRGDLTMIISSSALLFLSLLKKSTGLSSLNMSTIIESNILRHFAMTAVAALPWLEVGTEVPPLLPVDRVTESRRGED